MLMMLMHVLAVLFMPPMLFVTIPMHILIGISKQNKKASS